MHFQGDRWASALLEILSSKIKDFMLKHECFKMMINEQRVT